MTLSETDARTIILDSATKALLGDLGGYYPKLTSDAVQAVDACTVAATLLGMMMAIGVDRVDADYKQFERRMLRMATDTARARIRANAVSNFPDPGLEQTQ